MRRALLRLLTWALALVGGFLGILSLAALGGTQYPIWAGLVALAGWTVTGAAWWVALRAYYRECA